MSGRGYRRSVDQPCEWLEGCGLNWSWECSCFSCFPWFTAVISPMTQTVVTGKIRCKNEYILYFSYNHIDCIRGIFYVFCKIYVRRHFVSSTVRRRWKGDLKFSTTANGEQCVTTISTTQGRELFARLSWTSMNYFLHQSVRLCPPSSWTLVWYRAFQSDLS